MALFTDGTAVVTGASSGIGRATAIAFARDGCKKISLGDLSEAGMEETRSLILDAYSDCIVGIYRLDVTDEVVVDQFYSNTVAKFGSIDYAANVAGVPQAAIPIHENTEAVYDKVYAVNQKGVFLCERAIIRQMLKQERLSGLAVRGSIVYVTSQVAAIATYGMPAYSASKGGARGLSRGDALDYGPEGIRINMVAPGLTKTPLLLASQGDDWIRGMEGKTPLQRLAQPEDIANAIVWLSSDRASFITGVSIIVDGGMGLENGP